MGRVLEAVDKQFSRVVAIKELRGSGGDAARLHAEAMVTGNLEHPGIPPVYARGVRLDGTRCGGCGAGRSRRRFEKGMASSGAWRCWEP